MRVGIVFAGFLALVLPACSNAARLVRPFSSDPEPQAQTKGAASAAPPLAASARTTLLEENEHLRDLLSKALADKRELDMTLSDANKKIHDLEGELNGRQDAVASLTERVQRAEAELAQHKDRADRLEQERKTLAEMFAVEKRQRLSFEKELLEREIAERTHPAGAGAKPTSKKEDP